MWWTTRVARVRLRDRGARSGQAAGPELEAHRGRTDSGTRGGTLGAGGSAGAGGLGGVRGSAGGSSGAGGTMSTGGSVGTAGSSGVCGAPIASTSTRPQLTSAEAVNLTIGAYLARSGPFASPTTDNWDPTAGLGDASSLTPNFTVAADGSGTHTTVQAALGAATGSARRYILVKPGTYREQVSYSGTTPSRSTAGVRTQLRSSSSTTCQLPKEPVRPSPSARTASRS